MHKLVFFWSPALFQPIFEDIFARATCFQYDFFFFYDDFSS